MDYSSAEYTRSRKVYMIQSAIEYFVSLLVTDAFLAKLLTNIGINDSLIGIISSFISLAFIIQIMSIYLVRKRINEKRIVIIFHSLSTFLFMLLYIVPFTPFSSSVKTAIIILLIIFAYGGQYLISSILFNWCNSFVDPRHRAEYSAKREMLSLFLGMIFTTTVGYIIDRYEGIGNLNGGFLFIAATMLILNVCNFICLSLVSNRADIKKQGVALNEQKKITDVIKNTIGNRPFRKVIFLTILWNMATNFTVVFMGTFKTNDLLMSLFLVQIINTLGCFTRILISIPLGRFSDKYSFAKGFKLALFLAMTAFFINIFTTNTSWYLIIPYTILYNCCIAGTNQNSFNITYNYVKQDYLVEAMAVKNTIGGVCGFIAAIIGSRVLEFVQKSGNSLFGIQVYGQQVLSVISFALTICAIAFIHFKIEKEDVIVQ